MPRKKNPSFDPRLLILGGVLLLVVAAAMVLFQNNPQAASPTATTSSASVEVQRVSLADARAAFDNGAAIFLDVRDADSYAQSHVAGAILIPLADIEARLGELDPAQWIITYCT